MEAPGDPIDRLSPNLDSFQNGISINKSMKERRLFISKYNLDKPLFYFELGTAAFPDTLHRIMDLKRRDAAKALIMRHGNWPEIQDYHTAIISLRDKVIQIRNTQGSLLTELQEINFDLRNLQHQFRRKRIEKTLSHISSIQLASHKLSILKEEIAQLQNSWNQVLAKQQTWKTMIPKLIWHGTQNQYHTWLSGILIDFHFGISHQYGEPVEKLINRRLFWTILLSCISIILAFIIAIPLGVWAAIHAESFGDRFSATILFTLSCIPNFWLATVLLTTFANADNLLLFPPSFNYTSYDEISLWELFINNIHRLFLPIVAYTYGSLTLISRLMRSSMLEVLNADYVRAARARGISERQVIWRHAIPTALSPMISLSASILPAIVGGSVILENIFNIPGMGDLLYQGIKNQDPPVLASIFLILGFLTMLGYLLSDLIYKWVDPRINLR